MVQQNCADLIENLYLIGAVVLLLICIFAYFKPLSLSDAVSENNRIHMILNEFKIEDGEPNIDSVVYQDITTEQKSTILTLLDEYTYRRTVGTLFSNGTISGLGDKSLTIYVYGDKSSVASIVMASSGRIAINDKSYSMKNAEQLIKQLIETVE